MGIGDMMGKAAGLMGGDFDLAAKLQEFNVDPSMLQGLSLDDAKAFLEEKGVDLSALEGLGLDEMLGKLLGGDEEA